MKIQDSYLPASTTQLNQARQAETVPPGDAGASAEPRPAGSDGVELSRLSVRLLELARADPPEHAARLERLAAEIKAGSYQVDALAVSQRLIDDAFETPA